MVSRRVKGIIHLIGLFRVIAGLATFWSLYWIFASVLERGFLVGNGEYILYSTIIAVGLVYDHLRTMRAQHSMIGANQREWKPRVAFRQTSIVFFVLFFYFWLSDDRTVSRTFLVTLAPTLFVVLLVSNRYVTSWLIKRAFRGKSIFRVLIYASKDGVMSVQRWLNERGSLGFKVIGIATDDAPTKSEVAGFKVLGQSRSLARILDHYRINVVLRSGDMNESREEMQELQSLCDTKGVRLVRSFQINHARRRPMSLWEDQGLCFLALREEPLESPLNRMLKRIFDICVASIVLTTVVPAISLVVWICQRWQSPGPLFFVQERCGLNGRFFNIWKFRTMRVENPDETQQAFAGDPRIYPAGRIFRKLSIDELPQFINVLLGDMSVVGPRPHLRAHDDEFAQVRTDYRVRHLIKPGITGLAQVRGYRGETRNDRDVIKRTRADIHYLEHWSVWLDFQIVVRTALQMIKAPKTAL